MRDRYRLADQGCAGRGRMGGTVTLSPHRPELAEAGLSPALKMWGGGGEQIR